MAGIDEAQLVVDLKMAATGVINRDVSTLRGFAEQQLAAIARQSAFVAEGLADGSIQSGQKNRHLNDIVEMVKSFANTLAGLAAVLIEQVWNALVGVVWKAINGAVPGLNLAAP